MAESREFDLVLWGATGFTGQLLAEYLLRRHGADGDLRWALAARNQVKLAKVKDELGEDAEKLPVIIADSGDRASLDEMVRQTRAIVSTVGPYALFGTELVAACAAAGTDYCDLTGEVPWMRRVLDAYADEARASGARIVHCCGFDSIPSDLGVWFLQQQAQERLGQPCTKIRMGVERLRGAMSGGTAASMVNIIEETRANPEVRKIASNPFALCPPDLRKGPRQPYVKGPAFDEGLDSWLAPFVMAAINTRIVHRANALQDFAYGKGFRYDEAVLTGKGLGGRAKATMVSLGMGAFALGAAMGPTRSLLNKTVLPKPGEGPSPEQRKAGFFNIVVEGRTSEGSALRARVKGDRDPGYGSTSKMIGEAAVCLARDIGDDVGGGFWTPATALNGKLQERLEAHAGVTFELET